MKFLLALSISLLLAMAPLPLAHDDDNYLSAWWGDEIHSFARVGSIRDLTRPVRIPDLAIPIRPTSDLGGMSLEDLKSLGLVKEVKHTAARQFVRRRVQRTKKLSPAERHVLNALALDSGNRHQNFFESAITPVSPKPPVMLAALLKARASETLTTETNPIATHELKATKFVLATFSDTVVAEGGNFQLAINNAACGDTITLVANTAGHQSVFDGSFTLPDKSCTISTPITIRSSELSSLPNGRIAPADAAHMPKIRTTAAAGASAFTSSASWWILDGLEITDAPGVENTVQSLLDLSGSNLVIKRLYLHQKETGTGTIENSVPYHRAVIRAVQFEGQNILFKWSYTEPFIGYYYLSVNPTLTQMETSAFLCVSCSGATLEDNYLSAWWNTLFFGGGDTAPQNTANLTSATTNSATFSNTTGLSTGVMLRLAFTGTATLSATGLNDSCNGTFPANGVAPFSSATLTRLSGSSLTSSDAIMYGITRNVVDNFDGYIGICSVSGGVYTWARTRSASSTPGTVTWTVYETAVVTSVVGSVVHYTPFGINALASSGAVVADWNYGDQGLINDVLVQRNSFYVDPTFAADVLVRKGATPKGLYEIKNINRFTFNGNYVRGYPAIMTTYPGNQYGTAPWSTCKYITVTNNWIEPDLDPTAGTREAIGVVDAGNYATIDPTKHVVIANNLMLNVSSLAYSKNVDDMQVYHNTALNTAATAFAYYDIWGVYGFPVTNFAFHDNIVAYQVYGMQALDTCGGVGGLTGCYPGATFDHNVVVTNLLGASGAVGCGGSSPWSVNAVLCPVNTSFSSVGFTNLAGSIYSLAGSSSYKGLGSAGSDPGVDWGALQAALGVTGVTVCTWASGCVVH